MSSGTVTTGCGSAAAALLITEVASTWSWAAVGGEGHNEGTSGASEPRQGGKSWCKAWSSRSKTLMNWWPSRSWEWEWIKKSLKWSYTKLNYKSVPAGCSSNFWPLTKILPAPCRISSVSSRSGKNCTFPKVCAGWSQYTQTNMLWFMLYDCHNK